MRYRLYSSCDIGYMPYILKQNLVADFKSHRDLKMGTNHVLGSL